jgi:SAM-dependent methyltransferase
MNKYHLEMLSSPIWAEMLERDLLPWIASIGDLGDDVLEIGPGPGLTTDLLRTLTTRLTAVEVDGELADNLARRLAGTNVDVVNRSADHSGFAADRFSSAASFGVLHHVDTPPKQDRIFAEVLRVLRPGGLFVGSDGYDDERTRQAHLDDLFVPIDPETLPDRLESIGFGGVHVTRGDYDFRFAARKPE